MTASGDLKYNGTTSLTTQMATLNGYKTSGSITSNTTFQTVYTITSGTRGFSTLVSQGNNCIIMAFFEFTTGTTYASLTQLAQAGNNYQTSAPSAPNTASGGTVGMTIQLLNATNTTPYIQVKTTNTGTVYWYVSLI